MALRNVAALASLLGRRSGPLYILAVSVLIAAPSALAAELTYQHLFTIGTASGVNPKVRFAKGLGRLLFGGPARLSPVHVPRSVAVDDSGRIWVADEGARTVHMFHVLGNQYMAIRRAGRVDFRCPVGVDVDLHGRVYVVDACLREIFVFDRTGEYLRRLLGKRNRHVLVAPSDIAVSIDLRRVYVTDPGQHQVLVFNQEGETVDRIESSSQGASLQRPARLAVRLKDTYVLDTGAREVEVFNSTGKHLRSIRWGPVRKPSAFGIEPETGLMYVGDPDFETVLVFNSDGRRISLIGQSGDAIDEFHKPYDIYVDKHRWVYVVDSLSGKIVVFRPNFEASAVRSEPQPSGKGRSASPSQVEKRP